MDNFNNAFEKELKESFNPKLKYNNQVSVYYIDGSREQFKQCSVCIAPDGIWVHQKGSDEEGIKYFIPKYQVKYYRICDNHQEEK